MINNFQLRQFEQTYQELLIQVQQNLRGNASLVALFSFVSMIDDEASFFGYPKWPLQIVIVCLILMNFGLFAYFDSVKTRRRYQPNHLITFTLLLNLFFISIGLIIWILAFKRWQSRRYIEFNVIFLFLINLIEICMSCIKITRIQGLKRALIALNL